MVELVYWNPRPWLFRGRLRRMVPLRVGPRMNNFGDLLGPVVVDAMLERHHLAANVARPGRRLLAVGSVLHFARTGDTVWGSGINGKMLADIAFTDLDVRAVRGPRTRDHLLGMGIAVPEVYGDPALLLPTIRPDLVPARRERSGVLVIPNLNDRETLQSGDPRVLAPTRPLPEILERIAGSELVVGTSLHATVLAEALGVPARLVVSRNEDPFKYRDYLDGTGRPEAVLAASIPDAIAMGGDPVGIDRWDPDPLLRAFPTDLYTD